MKVTIIGGGNIGAAIAYGLSSGNYVQPGDIYVIDPNPKIIENISKNNSTITTTTDNYDYINIADIIIIAVKPWLVEEVISLHKNRINERQIIASIAANITLSQLQAWTFQESSLFRIMPNTAIAIKESMTFISSLNATEQQEDLIINLFNELGKAVLIKEDLMPAGTSLASCGIAYAFRYIRAAMEGGVELGFYPEQSKDIVVQTLKGAIQLLETNETHPEIEVDKVTTAGGVAIKGLNEMESAGFTASVIRGLKAGTIK